MQLRLPPPNVVCMIR